MDNGLSAPRMLRLDPVDNVAVAIDGIRTGDVVGLVAASEPVMKGHKIALQFIAEGAPIRKFGQIIGFAKSAIAPGQWVHEHQLGATM